MQGPSGAPIDRGGLNRYIAVMGGQGETPDDHGDHRAARLAEALRENLRRRKAQARARREAAREADGAAPPTDGAKPALGGRNRRDGVVPHDGD